MNIEKKVIFVVSEQLEMPESDISIASSLIDELGADSLDIVELIMALEDEFTMDIPDEDVEKIVTVGDIVNYIKQRSI